MLNNIDLSQSKQKIIIYVILTAMTLAIYWQVHQFDFVNIDDNLYVQENSHITSGITLENIRWAFGNRYGDLWNPLVWLSLMADYELYGLNAGGYHVTNLIFHILSALLLFWLFHRMTGTLWRSAFVAAFFALHPLHVESVAWVSERKDVLSAFFWMLTLCFYVVYTEKQSVRRYLLVVFSFVLALLSKPMVVTLPVIMILLDYWPLKRFENQNRLSDTIVWQLKEKLPFFALSAVMIFLLLYSPYQQEAIFKPFSLIARLANAPVAFVTYLVKTFWPHNMAVFYPFPSYIPAWKVLTASVLIVFVSVFVIVKSKRHPYLLVGWGWFFIAIAPVIGIIQISLTAPYAMADRYHYLPSIGIGVILSWSVPNIFKNKNIRKMVLFPTSIVLLAILSTLTWKQCGYWENSFKLWDHALKVTKNNFMAHGNLGVALFTEGKTNEALVHFNHALKLKPDHILLYNNRGGVYAELGQYQKAFEDFNKTINQRPDYAGSYNCRAVVYSKIGQYQKAIEDFNMSILLKPDNAYTYNARGTVYTKLGQYQPAMNDFNKSLMLNNDYVEAYINLAVIYGKLNQYDHVIKYLTEALRRQPDNALFYYNRGFAYAKIGQFNLAIHDFDEATKRKENYADAFNNRAVAYLNQHNTIAGCLDAKKACDLGNCATLQIANAKGLCR